MANLKLSTMQLLIIMIQLLPCLCIPEKISVSLDLQEEKDPSGALVLDLKEDSQLKSRFSTAELDKMTFQFFSQKPALFTLEAGSAAIRTTSVIDRDAICPYKDICELTFDLASQTATYFLIVAVKVTVLDINDQIPQFSVPEKTVSISEFARIGSSIDIPKVSDPDSPQYSLKSFKLEPEELADIFELTSRKRFPNQAPELKLYLRRSLDREIQSEYHAKVTAVDSEEKSGSVDLTIRILDANDNRPVFDNDTLEVSMPEHVSSGYDVIRVTAHDQDTGVNGEIVYRFSQETQSLYGTLFAINNKTGKITVTGDIDYEEGTTTYYLGIEAIDKGLDPIPGEATVIVTVTDINDHAPEMTINTLQGSGVTEVTILENATIGTFVARVLVSDADSGANGQYNCSMTDTSFEMEPFGSEFLIMTSSTLDREKLAQYSLAVVCKDSGDQMAVTHITIMVGDVNDNSPTFPKESYYKELPENNYNGMIITQVEATDADEGNNAEIIYTITGDAAKLFEVDSITGVVKARTSLDREVSQQYIVPLVATDRGTPPKSGTAELVVMVTDDNDEPPKFSQDVYSFGVYENESPGTDVGSLSADDADSHPFNIFTYAIVSTLSVSLNKAEPAKMISNTPFKVSPTNGRISTVVPLDREEHAIYKLIVAAIDSNRPSLSSTATVSVYVMDKNDNAPVFHFPSKVNSTMYIPGSLPLGYIVARVRVTDADIADAARLQYTITQASEDDVFEIDPNLGTISIAADLHDFNTLAFSLTIKVSDHGDRNLSTSETLNIIINNSMVIDFGVPLKTDNGEVMPNILIVVVVACISGIIIVALALAIVLVFRHQRRRRGSKTWHQKQRMEALKTLTVQENALMTSTDLSYDKTQTDVETLQIAARADGKQTREDSGDYYDGTNLSRVDLSVEKSLQWLEDIHAQQAPGTPPLHHDMDSSQNTNNVEDDISTPLKTSSKNGKDISRREGDSMSMNSGGGSATDSGRGPSEQDAASMQNNLAYQLGLHYPHLVNPILKRGGYHSNNVYPGNQTRSSPVPKYGMEARDRYTIPQYAPRTDDKVAIDVDLPPPMENLSFGDSSFHRVPSIGSAANFDLKIGSNNHNFCLPYPNMIGSPGARTSTPNSPYSDNHSNRSHGDRADVHTAKVKRQPAMHIHSNHSNMSPSPSRPSQLPVARDNRHPSNKQFVLESPQALNLSDTRDQLYSIGDMDDILETGSNYPTFNSHMTDSTCNHSDDDASTTSGSYVVDPDELIQQIDGIFFEDVIV